MEEKKFAVILSAYNGEKYIQEQLESILSQTYKNIEIVVRDDGSKDNTIQIVEQYINKGKNIRLIKGKNLGFVKSFFELLKLVEADYYAYCDQDDIWKKDKIERAYLGLSKLDDTKPNLFFSNSDYYDMEMNFVAHGEKEKVYNFRNSLVECVTQGMAMCINKKARDMIVKNIPEKCTFHDQWTYMLCSAFGELYYDDKSLVKYRRHTKAVTAEGKSFIELQIWRIKKILFGNMLKTIKEQIKEFYKIYGEELKEEDKKIIKLFVNEKYSFTNSIKKCFYPKRFRRKIVDEILLRIMFLCGII